MKTEELHRDGNVYSTANFAYNGRDQLTQIEHQGQRRTFGYDGHGRLWQRVTPEQGATSYTYNRDDTVQAVTDARGASQTFAYNARGLATAITFGGNVEYTPNVTFSYDAAGNRTGMTDGLGTMSYGYDSLSRLTSETRAFNNIGSYTLSYEYNHAGQLTRMTNPWGAQVGYSRDFLGRVSGVTGAGYPDAAEYVRGGIEYRATGAVKRQTFGNGKSYAATFDNRLRLKRWDVAGVNGAFYYLRSKCLKLNGGGCL